MIFYAFDSVLSLNVHKFYWFVVISTVVSIVQYTICIISCTKSFVSSGRIVSAHELSDT